MGRTDEWAKRPVTRRSRLLAVRCARCSVSWSCKLYRQRMRCRRPSYRFLASVAYLL